MNIIVTKEGDSRVHAPGPYPYITACGFCDVLYIDSREPVNCETCHVAIVYYKKLKVKYAKVLR